ncbi:hypothetical protein [Terrimonas alba]|uniref:hypothetical protein n=1 Tax=Terrimonas alba TaxID=3349636 RepID=UPI0035F41AE0
MFFTGLKEFLDRHVDIFKGMFNKTVLHQQVVSFRFLSPGIAIVETLTWISEFSKNRTLKAVHIDVKGRLHTRLLQVFKNKTLTGKSWYITMWI